LIPARMICRALRPWSLLLLLWWWPLPTRWILSRIPIWRKSLPLSLLWLLLLSQMLLHGRPTTRSPLLLLPPLLLLLLRGWCPVAATWSLLLPPLTLHWRSTTLLLLPSIIRIWPTSNMWMGWSKSRSWHVPRRRRTTLLLTLWIPSRWKLASGTTPRVESRWILSGTGPPLLLVLRWSPRWRNAILGKGISTRLLPAG